MRFRLTCNPPNGGSQKAIFYYDNNTGLLHDKDGLTVGTPQQDLMDYTPAFKTDQSRAPIHKHNSPRILKIQMGLSCNYSCQYCLQKSIPHADNNRSHRITNLISSLRSNINGTPENIQLWGGEPLVYIKTMKPLVSQLKEMYPNSKYSMITNGSLLTSEINDWLIANEIRVSISHDGPSQRVRGPDPFDSEEISASIIDLYKRKKAAGDPVTIGAMIYLDNADRAAVARWFQTKFDDPDIMIGEGAIIDIYDQDGQRTSPQTHTDHLFLRITSLKNIRTRADHAFTVSRMRIGEWIGTMQQGRMLDSLGMKCGMDQNDTLTVDILGNVLTCQNVSNLSKAPNGEPHGCGTIDDIDSVRIKTSVHFLNRAECASCPVVQVCKGGCMYLTGDLFYSSCENMFSDHIPYFVSAVEALTGYLPIYIEDEFGRLPERRKDIFGGWMPDSAS